MFEEQYYLAYVLGYDLLHDLIESSNKSECDVSFEICMQIAADFMSSVEYRTAKCSLYEALETWLRDNTNRVNRYFDRWSGSVCDLDENEIDELREAVFSADDEFGDALREEYEFACNIPRCVIEDHFADISFTEEDFACNVE